MTELSSRLEELARDVLRPLACGGQVSLVAPFGEKLATSLRDPYIIADQEVRVSVDIARVHRARRIFPVDTLPDISAQDWALTMALNDLLQVTNHHLSGPLTRSRHQRLLGSALRIVEKVPDPRTALEALARHALLGRVMSLLRRDTTLTWWTGSASFRGQPPSERLMKWPELRRVRADEKKVALAEMVEGIKYVEQQSFVAAISLWLANSPITDIATCARSEPVFHWSRSTLKFVATRQGCNLAQRALMSESHPAVRTALLRALGRLPQGTMAHAIAQLFMDSTLERMGATTATPS